MEETNEQGTNQTDCEARNGNHPGVCISGWNRAVNCV